VFRSSLIRQERDIVARDKCVVILGRRQSRNIVRMLAYEFRGIGAGVIHNTAPDFLSVWTHDRDDVPVLEFIFNAGYACVQKAGVLSGNGVDGAFVDMDAAGD